MNYQEALREWGALRLERDGRGGSARVDRESVEVRFEFVDEPGYSEYTLGYSYARVLIFGETVTGAYLEDEMEPKDFDFATVLGEIVAAGGGELSGAEGVST